MKKEPTNPAAGKEKQTTANPAKDNFLVCLVKTFLNLNYLKYGIKKDF
jgi:hypothetical protein